MFQDPNDEDEKFKQMLGGIIGNGPAPYDVTTSMEQPDVAPQQDPTQLSQPYMPQSAGALAGYTPPPAAGAPAYMDHVQGHQFGGGDIAMLGGILAGILGGGKHRGEIAGSLAGQYGGAVLQNNARADTRNQQIDQYNNQLENKSNDPLDRWKAEQSAKYQVGSLKTRGDELALQKTREQRIADQQAAEDAKDPVSQAEAIAKARAGVELDTTRQKNDMEVGTREMLGQILGQQKGEYASPTGKGAAAGGVMNDPAKALKAKLAQAQIDGIDSGTVDPLTGKPKETPKSNAQLKSEASADLLATPFPGSKIDNDQAWRAANTTAAAREKHLAYFNGVQQVNNSLERMQKLREENGTEMFGAAKSEYDAALTAAIGGFTQIGQSGVLNGGEFARYKDFIPGIGPKASDLMRIIPGQGDPTLDQLKGVQSAVKGLAGDGLRSIGISFDDGTKPSGSGKEESLGESPSGIKFSVDKDAEAKFNGGGFGGDQTGKPPSGGGKRMVTVTATDGRTVQQELSDDEINELRSDKRVKSVQ